ncbi:MAG: hypothetical protein AAGD18_03490 [Actinomycetota bacterium]
MSLVARHLESVGIPTVIAGSARDIVEHCGVPRFCFTDFPLGNPCGKPGDAAMQTAIVEQALDLLWSATAPRTTVQTPFVWDETGSWRTRFMRVDEETLPGLRRAGEERRAKQEAKRAARSPG